MSGKEDISEFAHRNRYWNFAFTENGEHFYECDICGKAHKNRFGFEFNCSLFGANYSMRVGFCHKCSNKLRKRIFEIIDELKHLEGEICQK